MFDKEGRIWLAATVRGMDNPDWCKKGSDNQYAKVFPIDKSPRQVAVLDPKTKKYEFIDTCFGTHHPQFGYDADNTLWMSGTGPVAGWINTKVWDETARRAEGGRLVAVRARHQRQRQARRVYRARQAGRSRQGHAHHRRSGPYAVMPNPKDGSIWYTVGVFGGQAGFLRFDPKTKLSEFFAAEGGDRRPRRRHRRQRRGLGLGVGRASRQLSTAVSARARSTVRTPPAITAPRA